LIYRILQNPHLIHIIRLVACVRVTLKPGFDRIDVNNLIRGFVVHFEKLSNITMFLIFIWNSKRNTKQTYDWPRFPLS